MSRQVLVKVRPRRTLVPSGTVTSAMNWAQLQVDKAAAGWTLTVAAGTNDNTKAANIITKPTGILDFITFSFIETRTTTSGIKTSKPKPWFTIDYALCR